MKIRLVPKKNPQKREEVKFYANPVNLGHKSLDDIARDIAGRSSLTRGDVSNVLYNFIDCLPHYLRDGFSIQLGEFGSMRVTLSSKGAEKEEDFKTATIKPRVVFTPGTELKRWRCDYPTVHYYGIIASPSFQPMLSSVKDS